jgi:hypothetical protein
MSEDWRRHPRLIDYEVSTLGRVRRLTAKRGTYSGRLKRPTLSTTGYLVVNLDGKPRKVHALVLETFIGPRPPKCDACHNDGVRTNNVLVNLRWASRSENMADARAHGTLTEGAKHGHAKLTAEDVAWIRFHASAGVLQKDIATRYKITRGHVSEIVNYKTWMCEP